MLLAAILLVFGVHDNDPRVINATPENRYEVAYQICQEDQFVAKFKIHHGLKLTDDELWVLEACEYIEYPYLEQRVTPRYPTPEPVPPKAKMH